MSGRFWKIFLPVITGLIVLFSIVAANKQLLEVFADGTVNWTGQGTTNGSLDNVECDDQQNYILWVFTVGGGNNTITSATLHLGGSGSGTYSMVKSGNEWKATTPFFTLSSLTAYVSYVGDLGNGNSNLTISHGCPGASPSPSPSVSPSPSPSASPSPSPSPSASPSASPSPSPSPEVSPSPSPSPSVSPSPSPSPEVSPSPTPNPTPSPSASPVASPSPSPEECHGVCDNTGGNPSPSPEASPNPSPSESPAPSPTPSPSENSGGTSNGGSSSSSGGSSSSSSQGEVLGATSPTVLANTGVNKNLLTLVLGFAAIGLGLTLIFPTLLKKEAQ